MIIQFSRKIFKKNKELKERYINKNTSSDLWGGPKWIYTEHVRENKCFCSCMSYFEEKRFLMNDQHLPIICRDCDVHTAERYEQCSYRCHTKRWCKFCVSVWIIKIWLLETSWISGDKTPSAISRSLDMSHLVNDLSMLRNGKRLLVFLSIKLFTRLAIVCNGCLPIRSNTGWFVEQRYVARIIAEREDGDFGVFVVMKRWNLQKDEEWGRMIWSGNKFAS